MRLKTSLGSTFDFGIFARVKPPINQHAAGVKKDETHQCGLRAACHVYRSTKAFGNKEPAISTNRPHKANHSRRFFGGIGIGLCLTSALCLGMTTVQYTKNAWRLGKCGGIAYAREGKQQHEAHEEASE